jgi:hypothetical protein
MIFSIMRCPTGYWLLLQSGIVKSVQCNCDHFLMHRAHHLSSTHFRFILQSSLFWLQHIHLLAEREYLGEKWLLNFAYQYLYHTSRDL